MPRSSPASSKRAPGELQGAQVWVRDEAEASRLYNKGAYGQPQARGALQLDLLEASLLVEEGKLAVRREGGSVGLSELLALGSRLDASFETRWLAFRDLRRRGYVVKEGEAGRFHQFPRGGFPGRTPSRFHVLALSERGTFDLELLFREAGLATEAHKGLRLALVDEEGDVTHYDAGLRDPAGKVPARGPDLHGLQAQVLRDRAILWDPEAAQSLHASEFLGRPLNQALQLSLTEALWLAEERGLLLREAASGRALAPRSFRERASEVQGDFALTHAAYGTLRHRGLAVKTGFKYGTHFRAYAENPEKAHAEFLAHALPEGFTCPWPDIAGVVRLAHSVRKTVLFVSGDRILALERARP